MDEMLDRLESEVVAARRAYFVVRGEFEALLTPLVQNGPEACEHMAGVADEFGAEQALVDLHHPINPVGVRDGIDLSGAHDGLAAKLVSLMEARDRLGPAPAARGDHPFAQNPRPHRRAHFERQAYEVDGYFYALRGLENPLDIYPLPELPGSGPERSTQGPSLTEQIGQDVAKAQPSPERGIDRRR